MSESSENSMARENLSQERELSAQEREVLNYVESHKRQVGDALSEFQKDSRFVLVGEAHLFDSEPVREAVATALARLQQEGLTHVALEANSINQEITDSLDYSDPNIKTILKQRRIAGAGWGEGNFDILIQAKKLGLKVVLIDHADNRPAVKRGDTQWQNLRNSNMFETVSSQTGEQAKVLVFIGNDHVHKGEVQSYKDGKIKPLGMRLVEQYGDALVKSVRYVGRTENFNALPTFMSKSPTPENISTGNQEVVIVPDDGPVKGDARVSAADFIITVIGKE